MLRIREVAQPDAAAAAEVRRPSAAASAAAASAEIIRDFDDPYLELVRLLREAAEIEHALMVQYLYGAYSLKPAYAAIRGFSAPSPNHLLGVAIQEMQHLEKVNRMLGELGSAPNLVRQGFPYEPDIYPFPLNLEPLSRITLAKYVYTEAPANKLDRDDPGNADPATQAFLDRLDAALGGVRPNHVGSLYTTIIDRTNEVHRRSAPRPARPVRLARPHAGHQGRGRKRPGALRLLPQRLPRHPRGIRRPPRSVGPSARPPRLPRGRSGYEPQRAGRQPQHDLDRRRTSTPRLAQRPALLDHPRAARPRLPLRAPGRQRSRETAHDLGPRRARSTPRDPRRRPTLRPAQRRIRTRARHPDHRAPSASPRARGGEGHRRAATTSCRTASPPRSTPTPWPRSTR